MKKFTNIIKLGSTVALITQPGKPWLVKAVQFYVDGSHCYLLAHANENYVAVEQECQPATGTKRIGFEVL